MGNAFYQHKLAERVGSEIDIQETVFIRINYKFRDQFEVIASRFTVLRKFFVLPLFARS